MNLSAFAHLGLRLSVGVETNLATGLGGDSTLLVMPQAHVEVTDHFMIQAGAGAFFTEDDTDPQAAVRIIYTR